MFEVNHGANDTRIYPVLIEPLPGGGFVALVPDLPGCMSDGATQQAALASVQDAIAAWLDEARALGRAIPAPRITA